MISFRKKHTILLITVLCFSLLLPMYVQAKTDNLTYTLSKNGTLTISGKGEMKDVPRYDEGEVRKVVICSGVTSIDYCAFAFQGKVLSSLDIPLTVKKIDSSILAYTGCKKIIYEGSRKQWLQIKIDEFNPEIYGAKIVFKGDNFKKDTDVVDSGYCGENIRWVLTADDKLVLSGSGEMFDYGSMGIAAYGDKSQYKHSDEIRFYPDYAYGRNIKKVVVGSGITRIGGSAFEYLDELEEVWIGEDVTIVGMDAFGCCDGLETVHFGGSKQQWKELEECEELTNNQALFDANVEYNAIIPSEKAPISVPSDIEAPESWYDDPEVMYTNYKVYVRSRPLPDREYLSAQSTLNQNTKVLVYARQNGYAFAYCESNGMVGWITANHLRR